MAGKNLSAQAFAISGTHRRTTMQTRIAVILAAALLASPILATSAFSAGDGGSGGTVSKCKDGKVWDKKQQKCVVPKQGMLDDDSIYEAGRDLAMAGRYGEAITVLGLAADKTDPRILNYLGYSHRKSGRIQVGLGYYQEALRINPDYTLVREYLGEAYIQLGDVASAKNQLSEIEKRCGTGCKEYTALSEQLANFHKI
jgi:tetratricopeptide (TPR) repeat protein